jgi:predicted dehydrogenase
MAGISTKALITSLNPYLLQNEDYPMLTRREFIKTTALTGTGMALASAGAHAGLRQSTDANRRVVIGIMGVNSRGSDLAAGFTGIRDVEIAYICDVDDRAIAKGLNAAKKQTKQPQVVKDFRRILEDKNVDALVVATPDHWHATAAVMACAAGKHVYVEKPVSHNPHEGELMIAAARKYNRVMQVGTQRRSVPGIVEAIQKLRSGAIGRVLSSRGWYDSKRESIGKGSQTSPPPGLDYALWQGPAPERPYQDNLIPYNWHWFWHWGTGEMGNNGIHALDLCRWGLGVEVPVRVTAGGGKYRYKDDQETPDTTVATYDFGDVAIDCEVRSWHNRGNEGLSFGAAFYGENGMLVIDGGGYRITDMKGKEVSKVTGNVDLTPHLQNFIDCVRNGTRPNADIEEGHRSTLLSHLGNIAYRTGHTLNLDPKTHRIVGDPQAAALWRRQYRPGWELKV